MMEFRQDLLIGFNHSHLCRSRLNVLARRPKVSDVAARAGVSTATVDRVLNARGGVRPMTVLKVERAIQDLANGTDAHGGDENELRKIDVILPAESGRSTEVLGEQLETMAAQRNAPINVIYVKRYDPLAVRDQLSRLAESGSCGMGLQVVDHVVEDRVDQLPQPGASTRSVGEHEPAQHTESPTLILM